MPLASQLFTQRQARLAEVMRQSGLEALSLNPGPGLSYLTGLSFHTSERPVVLLFAPGDQPVLVLPELEKLKLEGLAFPVKAFSYGENPATWQSVFDAAIKAAGFGHAIIGVEPTRLRFLELRLLEGAAPQARFVSAEDLLASLRMSKDEGELDAMRKATQIAQQALLATLPFIKVGLTERQVASELTLQLLRAGSDSEMPFAPIVSGGPNSANPHASPSDRPLQTGDLLVIDWGAAHAGYVSDLTRTFAIGKVDPEFERIAEIVHQANAAGRAAGRPGVEAGAVDRAARAVIETAGYGEFFTHRTGHGLGLEPHEPPYMRGDNTLILKPGMTYTVEPGIYLPGRNGVRIEDDVFVTQDGAESLSDLRRALQVIG